MKATLKDVAAAAGVGLSTASYVINRTGLNKVGAETQARIVAAARRLDYTSNSIAKGLRSGKSRLVGVLVPAISYSFFPEILQGVEDVLAKNKYNILLCTYHNPEEFSARCAALVHNRVDGVIVRPELSGSLDSLNRFFLGRLPCVFTAVPSHPDFPTVNVDADRVGRLGAQYLIAHGHRRVLCDGRMHKPRCDGFVECFVAAGLPAPPIADLGADRGIERLRELLTTSGEPFSAIFTADWRAVEIIRQSREYGWEVPREFSLLGVDGLELGAYTNPPLSTVAQPRYEQGAAAAELLLEWFAAPQRRPANRVLMPSLLERGSVLTVGEAPSPQRRDAFEPVPDEIQPFVSRA